MRVRVIHLSAVLVACLSAATAWAQSAVQDVNVSATVGSSCTINDVTTAWAINTSIPVEGTGRVDTSLQTFSVRNDVCTGITELHIVSMNGGVRTKSGPAPKFSRVINYRGTAQVGKARSVVRTGAKAAATGPEAGSVGVTNGPMSANLTIALRPQQPANPLVMGSDYEDVLRVMLVPQ